MCCSFLVVLFISDGEVAVFSLLMGAPSAFSSQSMLASGLGCQALSLPMLNVNQGEIGVFRGFAFSKAFQILIMDSPDCVLVSVSR